MWVKIFLVLLGIIVILTIYGVVPTIIYRINNIRQSNNSKTIYLTFDDGIDSIYTIEMIKLLKKYEIRATFFVVAEFAENNLKVIEIMKENSHVIGLHSLKHKNEILQTPIGIRKDFSEGIDIFKKLGVETKFFRPPWGHFSLSGIKEMKKRNLKIVLWDVIVQDWKGNTDATTISNKLLNKTKGGDIVCLHDGRGKNNAPKRTMEALEIVIPIWKSQGYSFGTVEELYE